tara:strand:+ start:4878 stop:6941 length:2064 start_codon:yes stop_codon:yes gene_type:complete
MSLTAFLQPLLAEASARHCRLPVLLQGEAEPLRQQALELITQLQPQKVYWLGDDAPATSTALQAGNNYQLLGSECDMLIINAFNGFNADLVAASAGCLKAGGLWLILAPTDQYWRQAVNKAHARLLPYPLDATQHQGQFIAFWLGRLLGCPILKLTIADNQIAVSQPLTLPDFNHVPPVPAPYANAEQQHAVAAILKVVSGHRKRPLVLVADRGRGKSAALGIAAALLVSQGKQRIVITAASPGAAATAIQHYKMQLAENPGLLFMPVDQLLLAQPELDLLLIDEAASIPTAVLKQLADRYSRIVFATTEHGYEGTGRGFQLRFQGYLSDTQPGWKKLRLNQPVRYQLHDPLEQLIFRSLLLRQPETNAEYQPEQPLQIKHYRHNDWLQASEELLAIFHLLSQAHYQTQIKDLAALLDNSQLNVVALYQHGQLLACALLSYEGELEPELCQKIYHGERRVQGHLLAQSLAFHLAQPHLAGERLVRVMRIAVVPGLQRHGLGSRLLLDVANLVKQQGAQWLGTSFGVSPALLSFWQQANFIPVRLSHSADNASSEPSLLMLQSLTSGNEITQQLRKQLGEELYYCLTEYPAELTINIITTLIQPPILNITETEIEHLCLFSKGRRPYELVAGTLLKWFNLHYQRIEPTQARVCVARLWQKQSWLQISQRFNLAGKAECLNLIRQAIQI